jgi:two-component system response regulator RegA
MARILLVDDDAAFRGVLTRALEKRGHAVTAVEDYDSVLPAARRERFSHVLLDLMLGETSALPLVRELLALQPDTHLVMLTGYASIATTVQALKDGAANYLAKPVGVSEVLAALDLADAEGVTTPRPMPLRQLEWEHIQRVLLEHDGNISAAARALGLHRRSLQRKLMKRPPRLRE